MNKENKQIKTVYNGQINSVRHYIIENAKLITFAKLRGQYAKGDIFNVYTDSDTKYGCEWDGISIESSIEKLERELVDNNQMEEFEEEIKLLPILELDINNYGTYNLPPTKKEGGRKAVIIRDVIHNGRVLLKKGTKGAVIPLGNFGLYMLFKDYNNWLQEKRISSYSNFIYESSRPDRTYDFFRTFKKDGKDIVGTWHTHISRLDFQYIDTVQLNIF